MPGAGPILLFDKSVLQSLSVDEAVWLDTFYFPCITPVFFTETLADLEKEVQKGRTPEEVVGNLAEKTPIGGAINVYHHTLSVNELLGRTVELRHVPVVPGGNPVDAPNGRRAVVYDAPPEAAALSRWQEHDFLDVERRFAKAWRDALSGIDLDALFRQGRDIIKRVGRPKDLLAAKVTAAELVRKPGSRYVAEALAGYKPYDLGRGLVERWRANGSPPITDFAPYSAHLLLVDLFFCIGLGADLIGRERPTNKIDIAYLYYLPFCMAFTSRDKLHERTAPLFLDNDQVFIRGDDLKTDLAKLDAHYSQLSNEEKLRGVMSFAHYPPVEGDFLTSKLWDQLMRPEWRDWAQKQPEIRSKENDAKIVAEINEIADAPRLNIEDLSEYEEPDAVLVQRKVPLYRGKWRMVPPEVEKSSTK
ncbi:MAG: hypothetical protein LAO56_25465 [Acidobacteriia bacterium]|nr:hypothetical protein [Terriglobia bacterium]